MREAAGRGFWISSHAPYGYNRVMVQDGPKKRPTLEIDPDVAPTVKLVAREYVDEAESGRIADRPQFQQMLDEASKPEAPFKEILIRQTQ